MKKGIIGLLLATSGIFCMNNANATITVYGRGGATSSGGTTHVCPEPDQLSICGSIDLASNNDFQPGLETELHVNGEVLLIRVETVTGEVSEDGSIQGKDFSFTIVEKKS